MFLSLFLHLFVLGAASLFFVKPPEFGAGDPNAVEVSLSSGGARTPSQPRTREDVSSPLPQRIPAESVPAHVAAVSHAPAASPQSPAPAPPASPQQAVGNGSGSGPASAGVVTGMKADYLFNPSPPYPDAARRRGQEGQVILFVVVDRSGAPMTVSIKKSSGVSVLDEAALKAVKKWKFKPATLAGIPVVFSVDVPIRFGLK